jgi:hypothetical protein
MNNQPDDLENRVINTPLSNLSEQEASLLIEQYKLYVEMMDKVSERRHHANTFFLTANSFLVTALTGLASSIQKTQARFAWLIVGSVVGIIFSLTWYRLIRSYSQLNRGKFKIIHSLETHLPARLFTLEWDVLRRGDGSVYTPFTSTERFVPLAFLALYLVLAVFVVSNLF